MLGSQVAISTKGGDNAIGRFEGDPLSWMITLKGNDGNVTRDPMIPGPGQYAAVQSAWGGDWNVLGGTRWWREK